MATIIDLTDLGDRGFIIRGGAAYDRAGYSVSSAGDINRDGFADMIVGATGADGNGTDSGRSYVLFGHKGGFDAIDLAHLSLADGFSVTGESKAGLAGASVSLAGDFNGDGYDDFVVGSPANGKDVGAAYVIYGKAGGFLDISLDALAPTDGFKISGGPADRAGTSVSAAGDVNGDGFADVMVGAPWDGGGGAKAGAAYVIFGAAGGYDSIDLKNLPVPNGFTIHGDASKDYAGYSVSGAGDINGDGFTDVIVGAGYGDNGGRDAGEAYVIFGKATGFGQDGLIDLTNLAASDGFVIQGDAAGDHAGLSVSSAGDFNADGYADLIVGAPRGDDGGGPITGEAYVIFGEADGFGPIDLSHVTPSIGFIIQGDVADLLTGQSVSSAGDVNGDGFGDVIVGSLGGNNFAGEAYVIYGKESGFGTIDLANLADSAGFIIHDDTDGDGAGDSVSSAGDVNGDGFADIIVGAPFADDPAISAGNAYVIYGSAPTDDVRRDGTLIDNTIHGGAGNDVLRGRAGDDTLIGAAGDDMLEGQGGDDDLTGGDGADKLIGGVGDDIMRGGEGDDRLVGNRGADVLFGGQGRDILSGGDGADQFHFTATGSAPDAKHADRIVDFHQVSHDVIDLSDFDAKPGTPAIDPFTFVGTAAFSGAAGELRYEVAGGDTLVSVDTDGDKTADLTIVLTGNVTLTAADFLFADASIPTGGARPLLTQVDLAAGPHLYLA